MVCNPYGLPTIFTSKHIKYYRHVVGIRGLVCAMKGKLREARIPWTTKTTKKPTLLEMNRPDIKFPFYLRVPSSDVPTFEQIFIDKEYNFDVKSPPKTIVDAGANIGLASIYFTNKFPNSNIIAVEPEESNFEILKTNVAPYDNIIPIRAALWHENKEITLVDPDAGKWGFMTQERDNIEESFGEILQEVQGVTVDTIMKEHRIEHIDILKIDIEGAEREVLRDPSSWLGKVDALIVELHERMKPGCELSFYNATKGFDDVWVQGENVYVTRSEGCLTRCSA
jgi:FkbM family methyltransferase